MQNSGGNEKTIPEQQESDNMDQRLREQMKRIRHKVMVLSGKGGVGKSTVAANIAVALALEGKRWGSWTWTFTDPVSPSFLTSRVRRR